MKITAQFALWSSAVFALICLGIGLHGLSTLDAMADQAVRSDVRGFALFWIFLGGVAVLCGIAPWWIIRREKAHPSDE